MPANGHVVAFLCCVAKIVELAVREVVHNRPVENITALANPEALELYKNIAELSS